LEIGLGAFKLDQRGRVEVGDTGPQGHAQGVVLDVVAAVAKLGRVGVADGKIIRR
jgi:hypothetical protein